jgi:hypothetical protein
MEDAGGRSSIAHDELEGSVWAIISLLKIGMFLSILSVDNFCSGYTEYPSELAHDVSRWITNKFEFVDVASLGPKKCTLLIPI